MIAFLVRRTLLAGLTSFAISVIAFLAVQLPPGDFASTYVQNLLGGPNAPSTIGNLELEAQLREDLGLDQPQFVQYGKWVWRMIRLEFGT